MRLVAPILVVVLAAGAAPAEAVTAAPARTVTLARSAGAGPTFLLPVRGQALAGNTTSATCSGFAPAEVLCDESFTATGPHVAFGVDVDMDGHFFVRLEGEQSGSDWRISCTTTPVSIDCMLDESPYPFIAGETVRLFGDAGGVEGLAAVGFGEWEARAFATS